MSLNTWNLYKRGFKEQAAQRARFPPPSVGHMPADKGEQEARTFGPLKLFTCISKTDYASLLNEDMLNPLNCNWRENYYSTSILCSLISLSIFIKIKSSDLEKLLGGNWEIRRFFFLLLLFLKVVTATENGFSSHLLYQILHESWIFKNEFLKNKLFKKAHKSRANLETNDWTLFMGHSHIYYKSDSHEHPFTGITIVSIEIHFSQTFIIT